MRCIPAALVIASLLTGCSSTPTAPRDDVTAPTTSSLSGTVVDSAGQPVRGARVENVDGQGTTASTLSGDAGRYVLQVPSSGSIRVRASKDGYTSSEYRVDLPRLFPADFVLQFTGPSFVLSGTYTVTFSADAACTQFPASIRTRTYTASITPAFSPNGYVATLSGAQFYGNRFIAQVAGNAASFTTLPDGREAVVHEQVTDSTSIWIDFFAKAPAVDAPSFSVPMYGDYTYCGDDDDNRLNPTRCRIPPLTCTSANHTFTLTRR